MFSKRRQLSRRKPSSAYRIDALEHLEDRTLLSGNVQAWYNGSQLTVVGDHADNQVDISVAPDGAFVVEGLNGTTVNGQSLFSRNGGNLATIAVNMQGGDDVLNVMGSDPMMRTALPGVGWFAMGDGNDMFRLGNIDFHVSTTVYGGTGNDDLGLMGFHTGASFFDAGNGDDIVNVQQGDARDYMYIRGGWGLDQIDVIGTNVGGWLHIAGGQDTDQVHVQQVMTGYLGIWGEWGNDSILVDQTQVRWHAGLDGGLGNDMVEMRNSQVGHFLNLRGHEGDDIIRLNNSNVAWEVYIYGWRGNDRIDVAGSQARTVQVESHWGNDDVSVRDSMIQWNLVLITGDDSDLANVVNTQVGGFVYYDGGWGNDGFAVTDSQIDGNLKIIGNNGDDLIGIAGSHVGGEVWTYAGEGDDAVVISESRNGVNTFDWNVFINMGYGNDVVYICGVHNFAHDLFIDAVWGPAINRILIEEPQNIGGTLTLWGFDVMDDPTVPDRVDEMLADLAVTFPDVTMTPLGQLCRPGRIGGDNPQVILIIDISGSTAATFQGTPVGDQNNDGLNNTILDAEIAAAIAFHNEFIASNPGPESTISVVTFDTNAATLDMDPVAPGIQAAARPGADQNSNGISDFEEALRSLRDAGVTNFEAALQEAIGIFNVIQSPNGDPNVVFLSDGLPNSGGPFTDEVADLTTLGANLIAFGIGQGASLNQLTLIDPDASIVNSTQEFIDALAGLF